MRDKRVVMKKLIIPIVALFAISCQQDKIGYVDNVELMDGYEEKKEIESKFNKKVEELTKKRDSMSQAFQLELQAFQAKAKSLPNKTAQEEYALLQQRGQFVAQQLQQEEQLLQKNSQTEMDTLVNKVKREIKSYGEANGYTYILGGGEGGSVLYGKDGKNLTEALLKILNDKYKN